LDLVSLLPGWIAAFSILDLLNLGLGFAFGFISSTTSVSKTSKDLSSKFLLSKLYSTSSKNCSAVRFDPFNSNLPCKSVSF
jgi:hypothetical protein